MVFCNCISFVERSGMSGFLPSRRFILCMTAVLLALSFFLYSSSVVGPYNTQGQLHVQQEAPKLNENRLPQNENQVKEKLVVEMEQDPKMDVVDNRGASRYLKQYNKLFNGNGDITNVDPNNKATIKTWWQAAALIDWYINSPIRYKCQNRVAMGNWHVCQDEPYTIKKPCLVYSFGINWDFSFDDAMGKLGCEVHSFDPSMKTDDHVRNSNVTFHNLGLGSSSSDVFNPRRDMYVKDDKMRWKMKTLKSVIKMLKHENRVIDVLKIDIEGHEWNVLENLFETEMFQYVRQFMLEFHVFPEWPAKEDYVHLYKIYTKLREMGFREFAIGPHPKTLKVDKFNNQGDSEYINYFFKKKPTWT